MTRLIDADALNYVRVRIAHEDGTIGGYNAVVPSSEIKNAPTIDAVPIRHGKWIEIIEANELGDAYQSGVYCSECEHTDCYESNYCPHCGAKMENAREDGKTD